MPMYIVHVYSKQRMYYNENISVDHTHDVVMIINIIQANSYHVSGCVYTRSLVFLIICGYTLHVTCMQCMYG